MEEDGTTTRCSRVLVVVGLEVRTWDGGRFLREQEEDRTRFALAVEGSGRSRRGRR